MTLPVSSSRKRKRGRRNYPFQTHISSVPFTFASFRAYVHAHPALEAELAAHDDTELFLDAVLASAAEAGCRFSREEVRAAMAQGRRDWSEQWRV